MRPGRTLSVRGAIAVLALLSMYGSALAEPKCTSEPKDKWINETEMKFRIAGLGYQAKVFKVSKGNCYEIYGLDKTGKRIEVYFHPITGNIVEEHKG
jgi:hypothetical protein